MRYPLARAALLNTAITPTEATAVSWLPSIIRATLIKSTKDAILASWKINGHLQSWMAQREAFMRQNIAALPHDTRA
jgi:hypothetical protein